MRENIIVNLDNPKELERLYRQSRTDFKTEFNLVYPEYRDNKLAGFWNERLNYESSDISFGNRMEIVYVLLASLLAALIVKIPSYLPVGEEFFYTRNLSFVFFPILIFYFSRKNKLPLKNYLISAAVILASLIFINLLPHNINSDTLKLSCIHLPLLMWSVLGFAFTGRKLNDAGERMNYLRFNGDLVVITAIILIAGGILTVLTQGLFSVIGLEISQFYMKNIALPGVAAVPIISTYVLEKNPQLVNKVSPIIAKIFGPVVLVTLLIYLTAIIVSGKDPYNDRDFLIAFNALLVVVMAIIIFSIAEITKPDKSRFEILILFMLSSVTIIVNGIALSAILFRISEWGFTPNRLAVLGSNVLMLSNLLIVTYHLFRTLQSKSSPQAVGKTVAAFLPVYTLWTVLVIFFFPFIFSFR